MLGLLCSIPTMRLLCWMALSNPFTATCQSPRPNIFGGKLLQLSNPSSFHSRANPIRTTLSWQASLMQESSIPSLALNYIPSLTIKMSWRHKAGTSVQQACKFGLQPSKVSMVRSYWYQSIPNWLSKDLAALELSFSKESPTFRSRRQSWDTSKRVTVSNTLFNLTAHNRCWYTSTATAATALPWMCLTNTAKHYWRTAFRKSLSLGQIITAPAIWCSFQVYCLVHSKSAMLPSRGNYSNLCLADRSNLSLPWDRSSTSSTTMPMLIRSELCPWRTTVWSIYALDSSPAGLLLT